MVGASTSTNWTNISIHVTNIVLCKCSATFSHSKVSWTRGIAVYNLLMVLVMNSADATRPKPAGEQVGHCRLGLSPPWPSTKSQAKLFHRPPPFTDNQSSGFKKRLLPRRGAR